MDLSIQKKKEENTQRREQGKSMIWQAKKTLHFKRGSLGSMTRNESEMNTSSIQKFRERENKKLNEKAA